MLYTNLLALGTLAVTVLADGASINAAIAKIQASTVALDTAVTSWDGKLFGALPITIKSAELLRDIKDGTKVAKKSEALDVNGALGIAGPTSALAKTVASSLDNIVAAKPKFDHLLLSPVILLNLELQQTASDDFSAAVIDKVPDALKAIAADLVKPIDEAFATAIDKYRLFQ